MLLLLVFYDYILYVIIFNIYHYYYYYFYCYYYTSISIGRPSEPVKLTPCPLQNPVVICPCLCTSENQVRQGYIGSITGVQSRGAALVSRGRDQGAVCVAINLIVMVSTLI